MRVLVVHNRYRSASPSGENHVVDQETAALVHAGHDVRLFERKSDEIASYSRYERALVPTRVVSSPSANRALKQELDAFSPDVVQVHNLFPLISPSVLHTCRQQRVPVVATLHNYRLICPSGELFRDGAICHDCPGRLPVAALRHGCYRGSTLATSPLAIATLIHRSTWRQLVTAYIFISQAEQELFSSLDLPKDRCFVKWNLVYPVPSSDMSEPIVVYLGRLNDAKGLPFLMQAWDRCSPRQLKLVIAGAGPLGDEIRRWAGTRPSVEVRGLLDRSESNSLLASARAAVVPSQWHEPFGLVVVEAMSAGVPAIAPARDSFPELIEDGVDGALYPPGNPGALAQLIGDLERAPERWAGLGHAAKLSYARRFAPDDNLARLEEIYRFAVDNPVWSGEGTGAEHRGEWSIRSSGEDRARRRARTASGSDNTAVPARPDRSTSRFGAGVASEADIAGFWQSHPCGDEKIGGLVERYREDFADFFDAYDRARYELESHIPRCLDALDVTGRRVLEVGLGQGAESEQLIRRGARWNGIDLTPESVRRVQIRLELRGLPYEQVRQASVTDIPMPDDSFDLVFSHGVLHHVPDILGAQRELYRVLRPGGRLVVMVYARGSLNYQLSIRLLRRACLLGLWPWRRLVRNGALADHLRNAEQEGLLNYLALHRFVHANTDGPANPYSRVYGLEDVSRDFPDFAVTGAHKEFMHAPPLPVHGLPGGNLLGWHLWVEMVPLSR